MTLIEDIFGNILIGLSSNAFLMIVIWITGKRIIKEMPKWIAQYHREQTKLIKLQKAVEWSKKE
jgi:hypothetical protein